MDKIIDYYCRGNEKDSLYWDYYCEQINELCNAAADMYTELESVKDRKMPAKKIAFCDEDDGSQTAVVWFNTAAAMLSDTDMTKLLEIENIYGADILAEKQKRINALNKLTKH